MSSFFTLILDTTGPSNPYIVLNNNATSTTDVIVNAQIGTTDTDVTDYEMKVFGDIDLNWAKTNGLVGSGATIVDQDSSLWIPYATSMDLQLINQDGAKNVYLQIKDEMDNASFVVSDNINLEIFEDEEEVNPGTNWNELYRTVEVPINFLSDRIQVFVEFKAPKGDWIEFSLGVFLLSSPDKEEVGNEVYRNIEAYDSLVILEQDKFTERYTVKAGTLYVDAIIDILKSAGIKKYNIQMSDKVIPTDVEYDPGTEKVKPISDFLDAINYTALWVDDYGYTTAYPYIPPSERSIDYEYYDNEISLVENGMKETLDVFSIPNSWVVTHENVDASGDDAANVFLMSKYENMNLESPTSIPSLGRRIVDYRQVQDIADQQALDEYTKRIAFEASQIYGKVIFTTAIMPFHTYMNILGLRNNTLGIEGEYTETSWKISLEAGGKMTHEARRLVDI